MAATLFVPTTLAAGEDPALAFSRPERVTLTGYGGDAMEPFMTRDGRYLLFNNRNDPSTDTNLHFAERVDDVTFRYRGELKGVNTPALEGVPTMDRHGTLYFVSNRSYDKTLSTIHRGKFVDGEVSGVELVPGISRRQPGIVNFDVEVSPDGDTLYFVDARFAGGVPEASAIVIARRAGQGFARAPDSAQIMENVNTPALQYAPCISADGLTLLFTRSSAGSGATPSIFLSRRGSNDAPFGPAVRLVALEGFVEAPTLSPDEMSIYYHRLERGKFVIYRASR